ncbi:hypothetical protein IWX90DRAFT_94359 [Phyllosticta citrichinensis]|uniref:Secreted protein n=1 Tax=Phyllosticta citrichinensis TaxID=1130410 RepID=A0ABR1XF48_9PEZI
MTFSSTLLPINCLLLCSLELFLITGDTITLIQLLRALCTEIPLLLLLLLTTTSFITRQTQSPLPCATFTHISSPSPVYIKVVHPSIQSPTIPYPTNHSKRVLRARWHAGMP